MTFSEAKILVVGMGGLGCPAALALAKSGVRSLSLADSDRVDLSNLPRQLWHRTSDAGRAKVDSAADRMESVFPRVRPRRIHERVGRDNAHGLFREHDLVIDATDGTQDKFLLSDFSVMTGTPVVYGGALKLLGQVMLIRPGGPCLRCLFETVPEDAGATCAQAGVLGPLVGAVGALQALTALSFLAGRPGANRDNGEWMTTLDGASLVQRRIRVTRRSDCGCSRNWEREATPAATLCPQ
jgi:molybdopterin-synthase adenylyltransferase